jgi:hypothetical protein
MVPLVEVGTVANACFPPGQPRRVGKGSGRGGTSEKPRRYTRAGLFLIADYLARGRWQAVSAIDGLFHLFAPHVKRKST